jgi:hypothetical protein
MHVHHGAGVVVGAATGALLWATLALALLQVFVN